MVETVQKVMMVDSKLKLRCGVEAEVVMDAARCRRRIDSCLASMVIGERWVHCDQLLLAPNKAAAGCRLQAREDEYGRSTMVHQQNLHLRTEAKKLNPSKWVQGPGPGVEIGVIQHGRRFDWQQGPIPATTAGPTRPLIDFRSLFPPGRQLLPVLVIFVEKTTW